MRYTMECPILSHDVGHNQQAHPSAICRYFQEAADRQMQTDGPSYAELLQQGYAFLLSRLNLQLYHPLYANDAVTVQTWAYTPPRGAAFERYYQMYRNNELVAEAAGVWALLNLHTGELCRTGAVTLHYGEDKPLSVPTRLRFSPPLLEAVGTRRIWYSDVDCNNHMNNTRYADMLCDFIPDIDRWQLTGVQIHYLAEAPLGELLTVHRAITEEEGHPVAWFETQRADGTCNIRARIDARLLAENATDF